MRRLQFTIPEEPLGKGRPRVTRNGTYTPKATRDAEQRVREALAAEVALVGAPDPTYAWKLYLTAYRYERRARDGDNLAKLVMDALNGVTWADDSQVETGGWDTIWVDRREDAKTVATLIQTATPARPDRRPKIAQTT